MEKYRPPFVYDPEGFGDFDKRRSFKWFLCPALFHQSQDVWMHAVRLLLGKLRSVERCTSISDFLHNHYAIH